MNVGSQHFRTIWLKPDDETVVQLIDQRFLPHRFVIEEVGTVEQMATAIRDMHVRGAGLIGASAGYGMYLAAVKAAARPAGEIDEHLSRAAAQLKARKGQTRRKKSRLLCAQPDRLRTKTQIIAG